MGRERVESSLGEERTIEAKDGYSREAKGKGDKREREGKRKDEQCGNC